MMVKVLLLPLCFFFASLTGVCPQRPKDVNVKAGEIVALYCRRDRRNNHGDAGVIWRSYTTQEMNLTAMSSAEQMQMGLLVHGTSLVILSASVKHQGNYSCSQGDAGSQSWFRLTVYTTQREGEEMSQYPQPCYAQEACTLCCPDVNVPAEGILNITSNDIIWHKVGESLPIHYYFSRVEEKDQGAYTCTRSYLYNGQIYNRTFAVVLDVKPKDKPKYPSITKPNKGDNFTVDLGSTKVIDCEGVMYSDFDGIFWCSGERYGESPVETNNSYPVFYNTTREKKNDGEIKMTASLVFKKMSEVDLSKNYTCKLVSESGHSSSVTITLAQKPSPSFFSLALSILCVGVAIVVTVVESVSGHTNVSIALTQKPRPSYVSLAVAFASITVVLVLTVLIYVRFKIDITLFLRDTLGCHSSTSDGKSYDAFLMCYKSDTDAGLNAHERRWLESVLEEEFGYRLCLYDRDVLPGKAVAEAVLDSIEQSCTMVLIPTSPDLGPGSGLLSAIHAALVERQTRLVFIKTEATEVQKSGSLPEALQLLSKAGDCVTWKGESSMRSSSSFWKQLRYYLPAPQQHAPQIRLSTQTI